MVTTEGTLNVFRIRNKFCPSRSSFFHFLCLYSKCELRPWSSHGKSPRSLKKLLDGNIGRVVIGLGKVLEHLGAVVHVDACRLLCVCACAHLRGFPANLKRY